MSIFPSPERKEYIIFSSLITSNLPARTKIRIFDFQLKLAQMDLFLKLPFQIKYFPELIPSHFRLSVVRADQIFALHLS